MSQRSPLQRRCSAWHPTVSLSLLLFTTSAANCCSSCHTPSEPSCGVRVFCFLSYPGRLPWSQAWTVKRAPLAATRPWLALHGQKRCYGSLLPSAERLLFRGVHACAHGFLAATEWGSRGGVTDTQKKLLILMSFFHIGRLSIRKDKQQSLLPPTVTTKYERQLLYINYFITLKMSNEYYGGASFILLSASADVNVF